MGRVAESGALVIIGLVWAMGSLCGCGAAAQTVPSPIVDALGVGINPTVSQARFDFVTVGGTYESAWESPYEYVGGRNR